MNITIIEKKKKTNKQTNKNRQNKMLVLEQPGLSSSNQKPSLPKWSQSGMGQTIAKKRLKKKQTNKKQTNKKNGCPTDSFWWPSAHAWGPPLTEDYGFELPFESPVSSPPHPRARQVATLILKVVWLRMPLPNGKWWVAHRSNATKFIYGSMMI